MAFFGEAEVKNLAEVIHSGTFCDKRGGFMDRFREDFARALEAKHALTGGTAMLSVTPFPVR